MKSKIKDGICTLEIDGVKLDEFMIRSNKKYAMSPTPWEVGKTKMCQVAMVKTIKDALGHPFAAVNGDENADANARLIASAPAMLCALKTLQAIMKDLPMIAVNNVINHAIELAEG